MSEGIGIIFWISEDFTSGEPEVLVVNKNRYSRHIPPPNE